MRQPERRRHDRRRDVQGLSQSRRSIRCKRSRPPKSRRPESSKDRRRCSRSWKRVCQSRPSVMRRTLADLQDLAQDDRSPSVTR